MAALRKTLPKNIKELLATGSFDEIVATLERCQVGAMSPDYYRGQLLHLEECSDEVVRWAVARGEDINGRDDYGNTPLHARALSRTAFHQIPLLLSLGAEIDAVDHDGETPLIVAAGYHRMDALRLLLAAGADPNHRTTPIAFDPQDPLSACLLRHDVGLIKKLEFVECLLAAGATPTQTAVTPLRSIGHQFERDTADTPPEYAPAVERGRQALYRLYEIFGVEPVAAIRRHDGSSAIIVPEGTPSAQYQALWDSLVRSSSSAPTLQGEAIRLVGRLGHELLDNGGGNWDAGFRTMKDQLDQVLGRGVALPSGELSEARGILRELHPGWCQPERSTY